MRASTYCIPPHRVVCLLLCLCLFLPAATWAESATSLEVVTRVEAAYSGSAHTPPTLWHPLTLPYNRASTQLPYDGHSHFLWLRLQLSEPPNHHDLAVLAWRYNQALEVYFNGQLVAADRQTPGRHTLAWNRPMLVRIQPGSWQASDNILMLRLQISEWGGVMAPLLVGEYQTLEPAYRARSWRQIEVNKLLLAFGVLLALVAVIIWLRRRQDTVYLAFAGIAASWSLITSHMVLYQHWLPPGLWYPLVHGAIDACAFCMYAFIARLAGTGTQRGEKRFALWLALAVGIHFLLPAQWFWYGAYAVHLVSVLALVPLLARTFRRALRQRQSDAIIISAAVTAQLLLFLLNASMMFLNRGEAWERTLVFAHFGIPLLLLAFAAALLSQFINAMRESERLNEERLRIYRDLHDDVGSHLLSIIHSGADQQATQLARRALESLRQSVSRANTTARHLGQFLAEAREECELRLRGSGHRLHWQQCNIAPDPLLEPDTVFHLNRIFKELISNIIRHADADSVQVEVERQPKHWLLRFCDNGCSFDPQHTREGNGLTNIRHRASCIGAEVHWYSDNGACCISLQLPLHQAEK